MFRHSALLLAIGSLFHILIASAQISKSIVRVETEPFRIGAPLRVSVQLLNASNVDRIDFAYRSFGQSEYKHREMALQGNLASVVIPATDLVPPFLEYYLRLYHNEESIESYPLETPEEQPLKLDLQTEASHQDEAIIVLSPEPNEVIVSPEELLVSFSLLRADSSIDRSTLKVFIDGANLTSDALVTNDIVIIPAPSSLGGGKHSIRVELFDVDRSSAHVTTWDFTLRSAELPEAAYNSWKYNSSIQAESRNENIANSVTPFNRLSLTAGGTYGQYHISGSMYITNEETDRRQPQNRFLVTGELPQLKLGYGDHYPVFPDLIMAGKRVRGLMANLNLGLFNFDISSGDLLRRVESDTLKTFPLDSLYAEQSNDNTASYGPYDQNRWAKYQRGTYTRNLLVLRPSFGRREGAHFGLTYLKSKDDITSIIYGGKPRENLVLGSDLLIPLDNNRLEISGQVAFSGTNNDITTGTFSDERIDSIYAEYSEESRNTIRDVRDVFQNFITINENLVPLNMKNAPTLAYEGKLAANYFGNYFKFTYLRHGNNYESFGESYVRTDVVGFNLFDRVRLANNQLLITGSYERLQDNTAETKPAITTNTTTSTSVSWYPRSDIPSISMGYSFASNVNDENIHPLWRVDDGSHRVLVQLGKEFMLGAHHATSLSVITSTRDDRTSRNLDGKNTTVSIGNVSTFTIPLQTQLSLIVSSNTFALPDSSGATLSTSTDYTTLYATARYKLLQNKLILGAAISPTFGDIERTLINARSEYFLFQNLSVLGELSIYLNKNTTNDIIWSFILRANI